ncbi:MAG: hypothetical protein GKR95_22750 [Gammaproteobacteria bacterium]|nr:hypothetical protein [Gammaproteobacteria bacterium]
MKIHAPYNFVPLSKSIAFTDQESQNVSHDIPLQDGLYGIINFEVETFSPLAVGGAQSGGNGHLTTIQPFELPRANGEIRYAIPGTSLRGMIRNVLEIVSFGKMQKVDDKRFGIRDLTAGAKPIYRDRMGDIRSGWLRFDAEKRWIIEECKHCRISHKELRKKCRSEIVSEKVDGKDKFLHPEEKYQAFSSGEGHLNISFNKRDNDAVFDGQDGDHDGVIIFTGQPNPRKKREFVFI